MLLIAQSAQICLCPELYCFCFISTELYAIRGAPRRHISNTARESIAHARDVLAVAAVVELHIVHKEMRADMMFVDYVRDVFCVRYELDRSHH
jgi:hypothetical protein